jgi:xylan 1,4-beta-xylosidase
LAYQWAKHCVERYGRSEVENWYWEVWNEPNIGYWKGTAEEFQKLHDYAIDGIRRALPTARVGGPDCAGSGGKWMRDFLEHCIRGTNYATAKIGTPLDFVSFHAKGSPVYTNNHVRMGIANQLRTVEDGFRIVSSFPELRNVPIVIGESDPEGCAACQGPQLGYRNGTMYSSYTAAVFARKWDLARKSGVNLDAALTWAFTFEDQPLFAGFRQLASGGIDLPVLNVFRMFSKMRGDQVSVTSDAAVKLDTMLKTGVREQPDVSAVASVDAAQAAVLLWHYHDDDLPGPAAEVTLTLNHLAFSGEVRVTRFAIDADHSNAFSLWERMGSPATPTPEQYAQLQKAGELAQLGAPETATIKDSQLSLKLTLPRQALLLIVLNSR